LLLQYLEKKGLKFNIINFKTSQTKNTTYICSHNFKLPKQMAYIISDDCTACGTCIDECPVEAITEGDIYKIDADICTDCGSCADVCPVEAISPA
jgi:ferredoxin